MPSRLARRALWVPFVLVLGCAAPSVTQRRATAVPALDALRAGHFDDADKRADGDVRGDGGNSYARLVRAITRYKKSMHQLSLDVRTTVMGGIAAGQLNHKYMRGALEQAESDFAAVEEDLAAAASDPNIAIELCIACWEIDWNGNGRIDRGDRQLFQIERDENDEPIPEDDPRRKPTFRFDVGDVQWARAFVSFQRAFIDVLLAYDWSAIDAVIHDDHALRDGITIRLAHKDRIAQAKDRILEALDRSDDCRRAYLAETDDDREWVPNPRQKSHPMPLPVDQALYDTWEAVVGDLRRLVRGDEGLALADLASLDRHPSRQAPQGFLDIGGMLSHPRDITLTANDLRALDRGRDIDSALASLLGDGYVRSMKASPLPKRLMRMKGEIDRNEERFERKLRYLLWLN
jgi:hypothetical protein